MDRPPEKPSAATNETRPGDLVHVDVKKLGRLRDGGGWRAHGRDPRLREAGDEGTPLVTSVPDAPASVVLTEIATRLSTRARDLAGRMLSVSPA